MDSKQISPAWFLPSFFVSTISSKDQRITAKSWFAEVISDLSTFLRGRQAYRVNHNIMQVTPTAILTDPLFQKTFLDLVAMFTG